MLLFLLFLLTNSCIIYTRSPHRPDKKIPKITTCWINNSKKKYGLINSHLEEYPIFQTFNKPYFNKHLLPSFKISFRNNTKQSIEGKELSTILEKAINELFLGKKQLTDFNIIHKKNFNKKKCYGLLVLEYKNYPFIVKLFIENPESFTKPYTKGFEPIFFFNMAGGINRHLMGFTRIKNKEMIVQKIKKSRKWSKIIDTPRKWFWLPDNKKHNRWIKIVGNNIGNKKSIETVIPGTYAIITDKILSKKELSIFNRKNRKFCMELCNYLDMAIDPNINNFILEKNTDKMVIVDTEHFPSLVGFKEKQTFSGYINWILSLMSKCAYDQFFRTKSEQIAAQTKKSDFHLYY